MKAYKALYEHTSAFLHKNVFQFHRDGRVIRCFSSLFSLGSDAFGQSFWYTGCHVELLSLFPNETAIKKRQTQRPILPPPQRALGALTFPENIDGITTSASQRPWLVTQRVLQMVWLQTVYPFESFSQLLSVFKMAESDTRQIKNDCSYAWVHQSILLHMILEGTRVCIPRWVPFGTMQFHSTW